MINYYTDNEGFLPSIAEELQAMLVKEFGEMIYLNDEDENLFD